MLTAKGRRPGRIGRRRGRRLTESLSTEGQGRSTGAQGAEQGVTRCECPARAGAEGDRRGRLGLTVAGAWRYFFLRKYS